MRHFQFRWIRAMRPRAIIREGFIEFRRFDAGFSHIAAGPRR
jgi:hypothetical protein